jgi:hypothetical protein
MAAYSKCVVSNMDNLEKGVCESQFAAFVKCAKRVRYLWKMSEMVLWVTYVLVLQVRLK